jgi:hypothetical protein
LLGRADHVAAGLFAALALFGAGLQLAVPLMLAAGIAALFAGLRARVTDFCRERAAAGNNLGGGAANIGTIQAGAERGLRSLAVLTLAALGLT